MTPIGVFASNLAVVGPIERTVCIAWGDAPPYRVLGAGTILTHDRVLTARGLLRDAHGSLVVLHESRVFPVSSTVWTAEGSTDVALLDVRVEGVVPGDALSVLTPRGVGQEPWCARGYDPGDLRGPPVMVERQGHTFPRRPNDPPLALDVSSRADLSVGIPGAAVWVGEHIVGVVGSGVRESTGPRLTAAPVGYFLHLERFLRAIGVSGEAVRQLDDLRKDVKKALTQCPTLCKALADQLATDADTDAVAKALMQSTALDAAVAINYADDTLARHEPVPHHDRDAAEDILEWVVPFSHDRRVFVAAVRRAVVEQQGAVVIPANSRTIIETVLAGVDGRACMFRDDRDGAAPVGRGDTGMPAAMEAPVFDVFEEAMVKKLSAELRVTVPSNEKDPTKYLNGKLEHRATRAVPRERLRYYFVLEDSTGKWAVAERVVREKLPALRLVRLGEAMPEDLDIESQLQDLYNRP